MNLNCLFICNFIIIISYASCSSDKTIVKARVESCPGCQLNRLTEVKEFIFEDIPKYDNVEFKKIPGAPPELVLLNDADEEIERVALKSFNRKECNQLLEKKGFTINQGQREL